MVYVIFRVFQLLRCFSFSFILDLSIQKLENSSGAGTVSVADHANDLFVFFLHIFIVNY